LVFLIVVPEDESQIGPRLEQTARDWLTPAQALK
jgi:hypothetical protein